MIDPNRPYIDKSLDAARQMGVKRGEVIIANIYHDDDCPVLHGEPVCTCSPDVELERVDGEVAT